MPDSTNSIPKPSYADLFAGIGGFASIFEAFDLDHSYSVEKDRQAADVYTLNWNHNAFGDIVDDEDSGKFKVLNDISILSAGFPCQPFSKSGAQLGKDDPGRGNLFNQIESLIKQKKPRILFLENVRNIAGPRHREYWNEIIFRLRKLGYRVSEIPEVLSPNRLSPELGGRPQHRERVYILGTYVGNQSKSANFLKQTVLLTEIDDSLQNFEITRWDEIVSNGLVEGHLGSGQKAQPRERIDERTKAVITAWDGFLKEFRKHNPGISFPSFPIWSKTWDGELNSRQEMPEWKRKLVESNETFYNANRLWIQQWITNHKFFKGSVFNDSSMKFEWQAGNNDSVWQGLIQFRPSGVRAKRIGRFPALVAITQLPVIGPLESYISLDDAKYLQGLPPQFTFQTGQPENYSFKQLGNGINSGLAWRALRAHLIRDSEWLSLSDDGKALLAQFNLSQKDITPLIEKRLRKRRT
jgi:DNA (cytosine-5)-methyltransferase 1